MARSQFGAAIVSFRSSLSRPGPILSFEGTGWKVKRSRFSEGIEEQVIFQM
jgi:hypothetical protein